MSNVKSRRKTITAADVNCVHARQEATKGSGKRDSQTPVTGLINLISEVTTIHSHTAEPGTYKHYTLLRQTRPNNYVKNIRVH